MMSDPVLAAVAEIRKGVEELRKTNLSHGEEIDRLKKMEEGVALIQKAMADETHRKTSEVGNIANAGHKLKAMGIHSLKDLRHVQLYERDPVTQQTSTKLLVDKDVREVCKLADELFIADKIMEAKHQPGVWDAMKNRHTGGERGMFMEKFPELAKRWDEVHKTALSSTAAGLGDEWVPTDFASNLLDEIRLAMPETNLIPHFNQPSNPFTWPLKTGVGTGRIRTENTTITNVNLTTANRSWTAYEFACYESFSSVVEEDSIIAIVPEIRNDIIRVLGESLAMAIVNGDVVGASHIDYDYQTAQLGAGFPQNTSFSGLRQFCMDAQGTGTNSSVSAGGANIDAADVGNAFAVTRKFGAQRADQLALLLDTFCYLKLVTEASSPLLTLDKYGPQATILTGELGRIYGIPVFLSHAIEQRFNAVAATGVNTLAGPNTFTTAVLFNRNNWRLGDRRMFTLERDKNIVTGTTDMVGTARWSMMPVEGDTTDANWDPSATPAAVAIINLTTS